ncbi:fimbria/pilus periplasmic chaperone [Acinetobacter vivianii]|uniref:Fimbria/pilus periplasmic chaperone n=1 Tax=Acinetobacter vivianii TaxID=1776742 RepID=A0AAJ6NK21_9GAMM|nr:fimbria/pilus periplasmic chaperone [Acinetobacter vivianii]WDZ51806.1 fimbria/pilus periplasmic chaperone [Acinetobacter vivianii]
MKAKSLLIFPVLLAVTASSNSVSAAVALDRTRVIVDGDKKAITLNIRNENKSLPFLAQGWLENEAGEKVQGPLMVVPPLQRLEPDSKGQLKIQPLPATNALPQDRETLYYFNLREIPPKSETANTLQLALQTRIKLFYRPQGIIVDKNAPAPQQQLTLKQQNGAYTVVNPTPYYVTLVAAGKSTSDKLKNFDPIMVAPKSEMNLGASSAQIGAAPVLTYINDYGGRPQLQFTCTAQQCTAKEVK